MTVLMKAMTLAGMTACFALGSAAAFAPAVEAASGPCSVVQGDIATCNTPEKYRITIFEVGICSDSACQTKQVLGTTSAAFDFASVPPGADVGQFSGTDIRVNPGTYSHYYMIWAADVTLRGRVTLTVGGTPRDCITATNEQLDPEGDPVAKGELVAVGAGTPRDITLDLNRGMAVGQGFTGEDGQQFVVVSDSQFRVVAPLPQVITVADGNSLGRIKISFDVLEGIGAYAQSRDSGATYQCGIAIAAPTISVRQQ